MAVSMADSVNSYGLYSYGLFSHGLSCGRHNLCVYVYGHELGHTTLMSAPVHIGSGLLSSTSARDWCHLHRLGIGVIHIGSGSEAVDRGPHRSRIGFSTSARDRCPRRLAMGAHIGQGSVFSTSSWDRCPHRLRIGIHISSGLVSISSWDRCPYRLRIGVHIGPTSSSAGTRAAAS